MILTPTTLFSQRAEPLAVVVGDFPKRRIGRGTTRISRVRCDKAKRGWASRVPPVARRNGAPYGRGAGGESDPRFLAAGAPRARAKGDRGQDTPCPPCRGRSHHSGPCGKAIDSARKPTAKNSGPHLVHRCQWASKTSGFWASKVSGSALPAEGAERPEWDRGPEVRTSWQSLCRYKRYPVCSVRRGMYRFGEFRVATQAVALASDVENVAPVEQAVDAAPEGTKRFAYQIAGARCVLYPSIRSAHPRASLRLLVLSSSTLAHDSQSTRLTS